MTNRKLAIWTLSVFCAAAASLAFVTAADVVDDGRLQINKALITAAQSTYDAALASSTTGETGGLEECYLWSRRIADAEVRADRGNVRATYEAAVSHEKRMKELNRVWGKLVSAGVAGQHARTATEYYLLEAKIQVLDSRHN